MQSTPSHTGYFLKQTEVAVVTPLRIKLHNRLCFENKSLHPTYYVSSCLVHSPSYNVLQWCLMVI